MYKQSFRRAVVATSVALLLTATFVGAQNERSLLKITRPETGERTNNRITPTANLDRAAAFQRINRNSENSFQLKSTPRRIPNISLESALARRRQSAAATAALQSFGTGGGDIFETEPNSQVAQGVSLPVNIFGEISFDGDLDFFAFEAIAGQQITIEPFAARLGNSLLIADILLFNATGDLLARELGDGNNDPLIRFVSTEDQVLIAGIGDIEDLGGPAFDYALNITRGIDVDEAEPNDQIAQGLPDLPVTIFGEIIDTDDIDFYSFVANAGQTLILDADSEVLGSRLDAEMNLVDPETGVEYFYSDQFDGDDPRFNIVLPYTGRYVIGIGAFNGNSTGFYRLNASIVSGAGAPIITGLTRLSKKKLLVTGLEIVKKSVVEVNGQPRKTKLIAPGTLRAKIKMKTGDVVTVINPPDDRRSNPLIVQ